MITIPKPPEYATLDEQYLGFDGSKEQKETDFDDAALEMFDSNMLSFTIDI